MKAHRLLTIATCHALVLASAKAATLVIDSFSQNPVDLAFDRSPQLSNETNIGDLKASRYITLVHSSRAATLSSIITVRIDPSNPGFSFFVDGRPTLPQNILDVSVQYGRDKRLLLAGYEAFEFEILSLSGAGNLAVITGTIDPSRPDVTFVELQGPGVIRVPFSEVNFDPNQPNLVGFVLQATSEEFSVKLGEFRAVPEPSSAILLATAILAITVRRRRT